MATGSVQTREGQLEKAKKKRRSREFEDDCDGRSVEK